ncbi:MAG: hypothetical protein ACKVXR_10225 [Planctomycetota bacterium]
MKRQSAILALLALSSGCAGFQNLPWVSTQRWPEPMENKSNPLPPGEGHLYPPGPEEVRILRHADPVQVRTAGNSASFPLSHRRKEIRVASGSSIACAAGGRAEILWPDGSSVVLFGRTAGIVGSLSRGEPSFLMRDLERAQFDPASEDLYELLGGAQLRARDGPVRAMRVREDILLVSNQSKRSAEVAYLDATIVLDPGQAVHLPILSSPQDPGEAAGGRPSARPRPAGVLQALGFAVERDGGAELSADGASVVARGEGVARSLGVSVRLGTRDEARFAGFPQPAPVEPAPPAEAAAPIETAPPGQP